MSSNEESCELSNEESFEVISLQENDDQDDTDEDLSIESEQNEGEMLYQEDELEGIGMDELLNCTVCCKNFSSLINLQRHYIKHITNKPFQCQQCEKSFFTTGSLKKHSEFHKTTKLYQCELCSDTFTNKSMLKAHHETHFFSEFVCNACLKGFPKKQLLQQHEKSHTSLQGDSLVYDCMLCDYQYLNQRDLEDHMDEHEKVNLYTCKECDKTFFYNYILQRHMQRHSFQVYCNVCGEPFSDKIRLHEHEQLHLTVQLDDDNVLRFTCELCGAGFPFKTDLETHYNDCHVANTSYPCTMCYQSFFFSYLCRRHKFAHTEFKNFECDQCKKKFKSIGQLSKHIKVVHSEKEIKCSICSKVFSTKKTLTIHNLVHSTYKPFICTFCGTAFKRKPNLVRHYMTHTNEKEYKCEKCNLSFTRTTGLKDHMKLHMQSPKDCDKCDESFASKLQLNQHTQKKHPHVSLKSQKVYPCKFCDKVFKHFTDHEIHLRQHTGERPYKCSYCVGRTFVQRPHLLYHHKLHHSNLDLIIELPFKCAYCKHSCLKEGGLKKHHARNHPLVAFKA